MSESYKPSIWPGPTTPGWEENKEGDMRNTCLLFHKWAKWEQYDEQGSMIPVGRIYPSDVRGKTFEVIQYRQKRACLRCGFVQDEVVKGS